MAEEGVKAIMHRLEQQDEAMIDILRKIERPNRAILAGLRRWGLVARSPAPA